MQLFIKCLTGKVLLIDSEPCNTILDVKFKIFQKENIEFNQQSLFFSGKHLENDMEISL